MRSALLVEMPDPEGEIAYREALLPGAASLLQNSVYASTLRTALELTGCDDPEARLLLSLYSAGVVLRQHMAILGDAIEEREELADTLYRAIPDDQANSGLRGKVLNAISGIDLDDILFANASGLDCVPRPGDGLLKVWSNKVRNIRGPEEDAYAKQMGLPYCTVQYRVAWTKDESGRSQPILHSTKDLFALGRLGIDGEFEHLATLVPEDHPVRQ